MTSLESEIWNATIDKNSVIDAYVRLQRPAVQPYCCPKFWKCMRYRYIPYNVDYRLAIIYRPCSSTTSILRSNYWRHLYVIENESRGLCKLIEILDFKNAKKPALNFHCNGEDFQELCVSPSPNISRDSSVYNCWKSNFRCFFIVTNGQIA